MLEPHEVIKALGEGKKVKRIIWDENSWLEFEGGAIRQKGDGWGNPNKPYKELHYTLFDGGWILV